MCVCVFFLKQFILIQYIALQKLKFFSLEEFCIGAGRSPSDICVFVFQQTDIELQFSTAPFRQEHSAFNFVAPTETMQVELDASQRSSTVALPASLHDKSSVIEVIGGGFNFSIPNYDNELRIQVNTGFFVLFLIVVF